MDLNPLIDRKARNHKKNKKARLSLDARCHRKQNAARRAARRNSDDRDYDYEPTLYCR